jgi:hypothetical protein
MRKTIASIKSEFPDVLIEVVDIDTEYDDTKYTIKGTPTLVLETTNDNSYLIGNHTKEKVKEFILKNNN